MFNRRNGEDVHTADFNIHDEIHRKWEAEQCRKTQFTRDYGQRIRDRQLAATSGIQKQSPRGGIHVVSLDCPTTFPTMGT